MERSEARPLIAVTVGSRRDRSGITRLGVNRQYVEALQEAGADVVLLPPGPLPPLLDRISGVLVPGGVDVHPRHYGEDPRPGLGEVDEDLDSIELPLVRTAAERGLPVFGVCRGQQVVNVALGGTLYQDIVSDGVGSLEHDVPLEKGRDFLAHEIEVEPESRLRFLLGAARLPVNSFHHQVVRQVAPDLRVTAVSDDGLIEALESADGRILTIQCHPEELTAHAWARDLFRGFVELARTNAAVR